jgi:predicted DNA-binding antitoxin AbrB/MazE fold protein
VSSELLVRRIEALVAMKTILAVYERGVFKPLEPVDLPENCRVRVEPETNDTDAERTARLEAEIHEVLDERYESGDRVGAERHNAESF